MELKVLNCNGINALPESIRQLTCLRLLEINDCPELVQWCKSEENKIKLAHIREIVCACQSIHYNVLYLHWLLLFVILYRIYSQLHVLEVLALAVMHIFLIYFLPFSQNKKVAVFSFTNKRKHIRMHGLMHFDQ